MACTYRMKDAAGAWQTITGKPAMMAALADGRLDHLLPGGMVAAMMEPAAAPKAEAMPRPVPAPAPNTIFTEDAATKARELLRRKLGQLNSGLDPEMLQAGITLAGYHIEKGARSFSAYAQAMLADLGDAVRPYLKSWYMGVKYDPRATGFEGMDTAATVEAADENAINKEPENAPSADSSVERDRQEPASERAVGDAVQDGAGRDAGGNREVGERARREGRSGQPDGAGVPTDGAAASRERSDQRLPGGNGAVVIADVSSGADFRERGGGIGVDGVSIDPIPASQVAESAGAGTAIVPRLAQQRAANALKVVPRDLENIKATLPYLLPGQQEDVLKAETRFSKPDGYGMLFTNGTGTGKTFSGLGVVKRFERQGKTNTLIMVPDDKIAADWIESGAALGLTITKLQDTKTAGSGIVVATYANVGQNDALASREWDLFVADEAHSLMQDKDGTPTSYLRALRALSLHPDGAHHRYTMLNRGDIDALREIVSQIETNNKQADADDTTAELREALIAENVELESKRKALTDTLSKASKTVQEDVAARQGEARPRLVALSATPFAYEKDIDWANGYLFDYDEGRGEDGASGTGGRAYNSGSNREQFFMQRLGYSMRNNKLTEPDGSKVDRGLMQRQLNAELKKAGSLSGRMLDVAADYDRRFVLVDSAIGNQIDEALNWLSNQAREAPKDDRGFAALRDAIDGKFDYLSRRYLLEAIKAAEVVPIVRQHMALGRKVVVFHDYKKGGGFNPFNVPTMTVPADGSAEDRARAEQFNAARRQFNAKFSALVNAPLGEMSSPIEVFKRELPQTLLINGDEKKPDLLKRYKQFQDDASGPAVMLVQSAKNKGWSGHDTTGKHQRVLINLGQPTAPTMAIQQEGRIYRTGQVSNAIMRYLNTGTNWEKWAFATTIASRASTAENLGMGELSRALKDSFISAFEESDAYPPGHEGEGVGGKERDQAQNTALTAYDRAKTFYWATRKKNSKTKAQEGVDYFATPEPLGLKMVEWLGLRGSEDALEPSGGHGAIARWIPETTNRTVIEPSQALRARLAMVMNPAEDRIIDGTFEDLAVVNKFDGIAMNPPFGVGGKTAIEHLAKAATHLRDGGRIVALIPTGPAADKRFDAWMNGEETRKVKPITEHPTLGPIYRGDTIETRASWAPSGVVTRINRDYGDGGVWVKVPGRAGETSVSGASIVRVSAQGPRTETYRPATGIYQVAEIRLPQVTFERAGTAVATRIVVLEKQRDASKAPNARSPVDLTGITDIGKLFDRIENLSVPERAKAEASAETAKTAQPAPAAQQGQATPAVQSQPNPDAASAPTLERKGRKIVEHVTKNGKTLRGIVANDITKNQAQEIDPYTFKKDGGWFIRERHIKGESAGPKFSIGKSPLASQNEATQDAPAAEALRVQAAIEGKSLIDAARFMTRSADKAKAAVAGAVLSKLERLQAAGVKLELNVAHRGDMVPAPVHNSRGYTETGFDEKGRDIVVWINGADVAGKVGVDEETLLHELVHAATTGMVYYGRNNPNTLAGQHVRALMKVTDAIAAHISQRFENADAGKVQLTDFELDMREGANNAFRSDDEVLAWALSSRDAQAYLEGIPYQGGSMWSRFVSAVRTMLGLAPQQETALSEVLAVAERLMTGDAPDMGRAAFWHKRGMRMVQQQGRGSIVQTRQSAGTDSRPDTIDVNGAKRPTTNSKGQPIHPTTEGVRKFWEWFGDSKVVDSQGRPLVVYHGTGADFNAFDLNLKGQTFGVRQEELGFFFSSSPETAAKYAVHSSKNGSGGNVMPVYLKIINPLLEINNFLRGPIGFLDWNRSSLKSRSESKGRDGILVQQKEDGEVVESIVVAFSPEQIKSAIGNTGAFDPATPDIRRSTSADASPAAGITYDTLPAAFAQRFPKLAGAVKTMLHRGALGQKGGLVVIDSNSETQIARVFAERTGQNYDETVKMFESVNGDEIHAFYDPDSGITFVVGPNLDEASLPSVILHEAIHGQQRKGIDAKAMALIQGRAKEAPALRAFLDRVAERMDLVGEADSDFEAASYIVEMAVMEGKQAGFSAADGPILAWIERNIGRKVADLVRDFVATLRAWALAHGVTLKSVAVDDLVAYARAGVKKAAKGRVVTVGKSGMAASKGMPDTIATEGSPEWASSAYRSGIVPEGWYVHGRQYRGDLDTGRVLQLTRNWDVADQYSGAPGSSKWLIRPKDGANILDLSDPHSADMDRVVDAALRDFGRGRLTWLDDLEAAIGRDAEESDVEEVVRREFAPDDIVNSAQAYDGQGMSEWFADAFDFPSFVKTPDGAVVFSRDGIDAVKVPNEQVASGSPDIRFSRSATLRAATKAATSALNDTFTAPGKLSWWHRSIGTMYNLAERSPAFAPVFKAAQGFVDDVSHYANDAADMAPKLLPKLDAWRDIWKSPISADDDKAIAKPVFEGTLIWGRDASGRAVKVADMSEAAEKMSVRQKADRLMGADAISGNVHKMWLGLPVDQYEKNINTSYEGAFLQPGIVWKDAELRSLFNLSDKQIELYREFRRATDRSLDTMARADMLRYGGKDAKPLRDAVMDAPDVEAAAILLRDYFGELAKADPERETLLLDTANAMMDRSDKVLKLQKQGYAPLSRFGRYTVDVVADGSREYFGLFETAREANQMAARMRREFGDSAVTQGTLSQEAFKMFAGITPETLELFGNALGLDSTGDEARDQAFQEYLRLTKSNRSAMKRMIHRQGIAGYSEDVARVLATFVYSNARQTAAGLNMGDLGEAVQAIPKEQGELKDVAFGLADYVKNPQEEAQAIRGLLFAQYLGGSIASAFVNLTQPAAVTFPWLSQFGGAKAAAAQLAKAAADMAKKRYEPDLVRALHAAEEDGTVSPQEVHQLMAQAQGGGSLRTGDGTKRGDALAMASNGFKRMAFAWGKVFGMAEQVNRRITFIAAYRTAQARGMADPAQFARKAVQETQFVYSKASKQQWGRGAVGGTLMTFKTYSIAYLELLHRMATQGGPEGKKAALLALGMLMVMGGAGGLPFAEDAEDVAEALARMLGYNISVKKARQELLEDTFGRGIAAFIDKGITGLPGVPLDVSGRLGMGNLIPGTGLLQPKTDHTSDVLEIAGPAGDMAKRAFDAGGRLLKGDIAGAALQASPTAWRNLAKGIDMATTGMYRDAKGYKVLDTDMLEAALKSVGFQPKSVATIQEANAEAQQAKNFYSMRAQSIRMKWAQGVFEGDMDKVQEARDEIADWNAKNPDQRMVISVPSVMKKVQEMRKPKDERIAATAPKAMRANLRAEFEKAREGL